MDQLNIEAKEDLENNRQDTNGGYKNQKMTKKKKEEIDYAAVSQKRNEDAPIRSISIVKGSALRTVISGSDGGLRSI